MGDSEVEIGSSGVEIIGRTSEESSEESSRKILFYFLEEKNFAWRKIAIDLIQKITHEMQSRDAEFKEKSCFMQ